MPLDVADLHYDTDSLMNRSFVGTASLGATAGQYSQLQLWNPANSGINIYLDSIVSYTNATAAFNMIEIYTTSALPGSSAVYASKVVSSPVTVSKGQVITYSNAALPSGSSSFLVYYNGTTFVPVTLDMKNPIVIKPGNGLALAPYVLNTMLGCIFQWREY